LKSPSTLSPKQFAEPTPGRTPMLILTYNGQNMIRNTCHVVALLAVLACSPVLTADAQEPFLQAGDYTLKMNIKAMGDRGKQSKPAKVMIKAGSITVKVEGIASEMRGAVGKDGKLRLGATTIERNRIVSVHYIGKIAGDTASGNVYFFGDGKPAFDGTWELSLKE